MILPDTSAWVEFLRATGSPVHRYMHELVATDVRLATTEIVIMEVLAGARDRHHLRRLRRLLLRYQLIPIRGLADYEAAAALYRRCQRQGETVRSLSDCLVAVVALRARASVLHMDRDFVVLASYSRLSIAQPPSG